jgi:hypothetical protein
MITLAQLQIFAENVKRAIEITLANAITTTDMEIATLKDQVESLDMMESRTQPDLDKLNISQ